MDQFNLLDLDNDVLNIIGDYVKQDNNIRRFNELTKKEIFDYIDKKMRIKRKEAKKEFSHITTISRHYIRYLIWDCIAEYCYYSFNVINLDNHDKYVNFYNEYLTKKKLNLKEKKSD